MNLDDEGMTWTVRYDAPARWFRHGRRGRLADGSGAAPRATASL